MLSGMALIPASGLKGCRSVDGLRLEAKREDGGDRGGEACGHIGFHGMAVEFNRSRGDLATDKIDSKTAAQMTAGEGLLDSRPGSVLNE